MFDSATARVYGADSSASCGKGRLGLDLCLPAYPADDLLLQVRSPLVKRQIAQRTLVEARSSLPASGNSRLHYPGLLVATCTPGRGPVSVTLLRVISSANDSNDRPRTAVGKKLNVLPHLSLALSALF